VATHSDVMGLAQRSDDLAGPGMGRRVPHRDTSTGWPTSASSNSRIVRVSTGVSSSLLLTEVFRPGATAPGHR
jgi:hypothetical protein